MTTPPKVTAPRVGGCLLKEPPIPFCFSSVDFSPSRTRTGFALNTLAVTPPLLVEIRLLLMNQIFSDSSSFSFPCFGT